MNVPISICSDIDFSNIENLYEQPLCVIKKCVIGKWKLIITSGNQMGYYNTDINGYSTFVDITKDSVFVDGDGIYQMDLQVNSSFAYTWARQEVELEIQAINYSKFSTFVIQPDFEKMDISTGEYHKAEGWVFHSIRDDLLWVRVNYENPQYRFGSYTLLRIKD